MLLYQNNTWAFYVKKLCKRIVDKEREIKRQEKEVRTTQRVATTINANIMKIQKQVERQEKKSSIVPGLLQM